MSTKTTRQYNFHDDVSSVEIRLATPDEIDGASSMPMLSFSSITAYHTCPTLGVVSKSYGKGSGEGRSTALEAGSVSHRVYAALRLYQLIEQDLAGHAWHHANRIFGEGIREQMWQYLDNTDEDVRRFNFVMTALYTSGYVDDMFDKRRTFVNIEESLAAYIAFYNRERYPVFVLDAEVPSSFVGVEVPVILYMSFTMRDGSSVDVMLDGYIDGIHYDAREPNRIIVNENKSTSRIGDAWRAAFAMSHQVSLYSLMAAIVMRREVRDVHVYGMPIPQTRTQQVERIALRRDFKNYDEELLQWILEATNYHMLYEHRPLDAPRFTHSCNRYFRSCGLLPLCTLPRKDRQGELDELPDADNEHLKRLVEQYKVMYPGYCDDRLNEVAGAHDE